MRHVRLIDRTGRPSGRLREALRLVRQHGTLEDVLASCRAGLARAAGVVRCDRATHHVLLEIDGGLVAAHHTDALGAVRSVTLWDHPPTAGELRAAGRGDTEAPRRTARWAPDRLGSAERVA